MLIPSQVSDIIEQIKKSRIDLYEIIKTKYINPPKYLGGCNLFYVYAHYDESGCLRYIGKGCKNRAYRSDGRSKVWRETFPNGPSLVKFLAKDLSEKLAFELEEKFIVEQIDLNNDLLINLHHGGYGGSTWMNTPKVKAYLSQIRSGENHWSFGKSRPPETREKIRLSKLANPTRYWLGIKRSEVDPKTMEKLQFYGHTEEAIEKRRIAMTGRSQSPEHIEARAAGLRGIKKTPEHRAAISAGKKGKPNGSLGLKRSPEFCKKVSESRLKSDVVKMSYKKIWEARRSNGTDKGFITKKARAVVCCETGLVYRTAKDAAESVGGSDKHIQACCVGRRATHKGFKWQYVTRNDGPTTNA